MVGVTTTETQGPQGANGSRLAFLGTGIMGAPMAARLIEAGFPVRVWNRTRIKTRDVAKRGASVAASPVDCVRDADVIIIMLESGPVVERVVFTTETITAIREGSLLIDMSSSDPEIARGQAARIMERGIGYVDAPVSGGPYGAEEGSLAIMAGAEERDFERAVPILRVLGRPTHVGPPGSGQTVKLCSQIILGAALAAIAETLVLAENADVDPAKMREGLMGGFADSKVLRIHGARMLSREFTPGGHVRTHLKDLNAAKALAKRKHLELPTLELIHGATSEPGRPGLRRS